MYYLLSLLLSVYLNIPISYADDYPKTIRERRDEDIGSVFDNKGSIFKPSRVKNESTKTNGEKLNKLLWQAAIEVTSFMPLQSSNSNDGIIITDWYSAQSQSSDNFKLNIFIKDDVISPDSIEVKAYERTMKNNQWLGSQSAPAIAIDIEKKILNRARELYNQARQNIPKNNNK